MCHTNQVKRVSLRAQRSEAQKLRKVRAETLARAAKANKAAEKRNSDASQSSSSDKENKSVTKDKKTTASRKPHARKTTSKSSVKVTTPPVQSTSSNQSAKKRPRRLSDESEAGPSEPKKAATRAIPSQVQSTSSSDPTVPKGPRGPSDDSEACPSDPSTSTSNSSNEEKREKKPYVKYDHIPEEYLEANWWTRPLVTTTESSPILFKQRVEHIIVGERWEEDRVEYTTPPSHPKTEVLEPQPIPSPNEHMQLMHALQHFVHTLNKLDTNAFEALVDGIDNIVDVMQAENKAKSLSLYGILMDTYLYQIFFSLKPEEECEGEGIYVRQFFELLKKSIGMWYTKYESTKEEMMLSIQQNITPLKMYGEKKVIPCARIVELIKRFAEHILKDSRER